VVYELHVGTFTPEGTWRAAARQLPELRDLGITVIEMMPVAEFPGRFGWGYDGVDLFAPTQLYGTPEDLRSFINDAHRCGVGVILDVVYNHFGPDGNYLHHFAPDYFSSRYKNEWGEALNFDGENSAPVREFFLQNGEYWIRDFHFDGLRLDATQQIFDSSSRHLLGELSERVRKVAGKRAVYLVGENEPQETKLLMDCNAGGMGLDALWNDDFHHSAKVAMTGRSEAYYLDYRGTPQEFVSAMKRGYLYQGQWYAWQKKRRGKPAFGLDPAQFITFIQNHDQVANSIKGERIHLLTSPGRLRAMTALFLLGPGTPMLFQGQEFAASTPFLYFADHNPELARIVAAGRSEFISQFPSIKAPESQQILPSPGDETTFRRCVLRFEDREKNAHVYRLHRDLLRLRREDPVLTRSHPRGVDGAVLAQDAFVLRFFAEHGEDRILLVNFGRDLKLSPVPEPLLAPPLEREWELQWSSENLLYGGNGVPELTTDATWILPSESALLLRPRARAVAQAGPEQDQ
jgi:maltooligosyltrehalose trehalohydrolase